MNLHFKYQFFLPFLAKLPQRFAYRIVSFSRHFGDKGFAQEKKIITTEMQKVFDDKPQAELSQRADYFLGMVKREALDTFFFRNCRTQKQLNQFIQLENLHFITEAQQAGRRVIISSGHFGRYWMAGVGLRAQGITVGTITRSPGDNEEAFPDAECKYRLNKLTWLKQHFGGPFLIEGNIARPIYHALDEHVMALFIDVPYEGDQNGCITLPFLGQKARFPLGPAKIAKKTNSVVVPFYVFESRKGLRVKFYPPIDAKLSSGGEITSYLVSILESLILDFPEQWSLWKALHLMWLTDDGDEDKNTDNV